MKKVVVKIDAYDNSEERRAMKAVSTLSGIDSIAIDMEEQKMTVMGEVDHVDVVGKLRKLWRIELVFVGPPKELENKPEENAIADIIIAYPFAYNPYRTLYGAPETCCVYKDNPNVVLFANRECFGDNFEIPSLTCLRRLCPR